MEVSVGLVLMGVVVFVMIFVNIGLVGFYILVLDINICVGIGLFEILKFVFLWINDGFMVIFFFFIGLEIK